MIGFLRKLWTFVRPYKGRLILGALCGVLFALANGALILAIKVVVNLVFSRTALALADELAKAPRFSAHLRLSWLSGCPSLRALISAGAVLVISTIPAIMFLRGVFGYLNAY
jgi:subfamily B ATP-binding cassette protein MsbA